MDCLRKWVDTYKNLSNYPTPGLSALTADQAQVYQLKKVVFHQYLY